MRPHALFVLAMLLIAGAPLSAQPARRNAPIDLPHRLPEDSRYVPFPFDQDAEALVQSQLDTLKKLEPFKDFVEKLLRDPSKFQVNADLIKRLNLEDPKVQAQLKKWVEKDLRGKLSTSPAERKKLQEDVRQIIKTQPPPTATEPLPAPAAADMPSGTPPPAPDPDEGARDWMKDIMERAEASRLGEWLRESPAWRDVFADLARHAPTALRAPNTAGLERLTRGLFKLDRLPMPDPKVLERLGQLKPPRLPRWTPSLPSLSRPSLPAVGPPPLPTTSSLERLAVWLLGLGLAAVFVWQASKWRLHRGAQRQAVSAVGPWPVDPQAVATRAELIQAFDYLAVLQLGPQARAWHHHAISRQLAERDAARADLAARLAALYEQARYTRGEEALAAHDREQARSALTQFAGGATA